MIFAGIDNPYIFNQSTLFTMCDNCNFDDCEFRYGPGGCDCDCHSKCANVDCKGNCLCDCVGDCYCIRECRCYDNLEHNITKCDNEENNEENNDGNAAVPRKSCDTTPSASPVPAPIYDPNGYCSDWMAYMNEDMMDDNKCKYCVICPDCKHHDIEICPVNKCDCTDGDHFCEDWNGHEDCDECGLCHSYDDACEFVDQCVC